MPKEGLQLWTHPENSSITYRLSPREIEELDQMWQRSQETARYLSQEHPEMYQHIHAIAQQVSAMTPEEVDLALTQRIIPQGLFGAIEAARNLFTDPLSPIE